MPTYKVTFLDKTEEDVEADEYQYERPWVVFYEKDSDLPINRVDILRLKENRVTRIELVR